MVGYDETASKEMHCGAMVGGPGYAYGGNTAVMSDRRPLSSVSTSAGPTPGLDERITHPSQLLDGLRAGTPEDGAGGLSDSKRAQSRKVFVGGIPQDMTQVDLCNIFNKYALVKKAWLQKFRPSTQGSTPPRNHRGFGFVVFEEDGAVESILGQSTSKFVVLPDGKRLDVKRAVSSSEIVTSPRVGGGGGGGSAAPRSSQLGRLGTPMQQQHQMAPAGGLHHGVGHPMQCPWPATHGSYTAAPMHFQQPTPMMPMPWADGRMQQVQPGYAMLPEMLSAQVGWGPAGHTGGMAMAPAAWQVCASADPHGQTAPSVVSLMAAGHHVPHDGSPPRASR